MEYLVIFVFLTLININLFVSRCQIFTSLGFDSQALFVWQFSSIKELLPFKDIFYPYGLLNYYLTKDSINSFIYSFIFIISLLIFFYVFKKIFEKKMFYYLSFFTFLIFVQLFIGVDVFIRYGLPLGIFLAYTFNVKEKKELKLSPIVYGFLSGIVLSLFFDSGIYLFSLIFLITVIYPHFLKSNRKLKNYFFTIFNVLFGFILGLIPFLNYLFANDVIKDFILYFKDLGDYFYIAKIPFTPGMLSSENVFTIAVLLVTIIFILFKLSKKIKDKNQIVFIQLITLIYLILLEQKNILRSIDNSISFVALFLFILIIYDLTLIFNKYKTTIIVFSIVILSFVFTFFKPINFSIVRADLNNEKCIEANKKNFLKNDTYKRLIEDKSIKGNIYSYPSDPVLYFLFDQKPPKYFSIYEGSTLNKQQELINYIEENEITFVILNTKTKALQDSVPDFIRAPLLTKHVLNNFYPIKKIDDYLILKRESKDFLSYDLNNNDSKKYFLDINFKAIPNSEGIYKFNSLDPKHLIKKGSPEDINNYLKINNLSSNNKLIVLESLKDNKIIIETDNKKKTIISFDKCRNKCIINLNRAPLFYQNRIVKKIEVKGLNGDIEIYENKTDLFW